MPPFETTKVGVGGGRGSKETRWLCDQRDGEGVERFRSEPYLRLCISSLIASFYPGVQMSAKELCKSEKAIAKKLPRVD